MCFHTNCWNCQMFCDYTKIEYQDHSEYFNLPISEELRRRAIEAFDSEFVFGVRGQERRESWLPLQVRLFR